MNVAQGDGELAFDKIKRVIARLKDDGQINPYVPASLVGKLVDRARGIGLVPVDAYVGMKTRIPVKGLVCDDNRDDAWLDHGRLRDRVQSAVCARRRRAPHAPQEPRSRRRGDRLRRYAVPARHRARSQVLPATS